MTSDYQGRGRLHVAFAPVLAGLLFMSTVSAMAASGSVDPTFDAGTGWNGWPFAIMVQDDGKVLVGGWFTRIAGGTHAYLSRLNADGSLDPAFAFSIPGMYGYVESLAIQADGRVLASGLIVTDSNESHSRILRLNANGSVDATFDAGTGADARIYPMLLLPDAKVLLGGQFTAVNGTTRRGVARLNPDGSVDPTFDPGVGPSSVTVNALAVQDDGKVLVGGAFTTFGLATHRKIARLNPDGSLDSAFDTAFESGSVNALVLQPDGKLLVGGSFDAVDGTSRNRIARLNADGSLDTTFDPGAGANNAVNSLALQADGKVVLCGVFTSIDGTPRSRLARLNANGTLDITFDPGSGPNGQVLELAQQADGKVLVGGLLSMFGDTPREYIARLSCTDWARQKIAVATDGTSVTWTLEGAFPQPWRVLFEESTDGAAWNPLGSGVAVPGVGYQLTGLHLPLHADYSVRATGWVMDGRGGSGSIQRPILRLCNLNYAAGPGGSIMGRTPQTVEYGASGTTVTAVAGPGYHFVRWSDDSTANPRRDTAVTASLDVVASFASQICTVVFQTDGTTSTTLVGDTIQTIEDGGTCTPVTAVGTRRQLFSKWMSNGRTYSASNPLTVSGVTEDMTLTAMFDYWPADARNWTLYR